MAGSVDRYSGFMRLFLANQSEYGAMGIERAQRPRRAIWGLVCRIAEIAGHVHYRAARRVCRDIVSRHDRA